MSPEHPEEEQERSEGVRISDRRRIDPVTFQARQPETPAAAAGAAEEEALPPPTQAEEQVALAEANARAEEALADAKRVAAEYANYRRRVDRDRDVQRDVAIGSVLGELLPILDDVARAQEHGELTGGFKSVADALQAVADKFGLEPFGTVRRAVRPGAARGDDLRDQRRGQRADRAGGVSDRVSAARQTAATGPRGSRGQRLARPTPRITEGV